MTFDKADRALKKLAENILMKRTKPLLLIAACGSMLMLSAFRAQSQQSGAPYLKVDLGGNVTEDTALHSFFGPVFAGSKVTFDPGIRAGFAGGYQLLGWLGVEGQVGVMANQIRSITGAFNVHDSSFLSVPFMANLRLQLPNRTAFTPYIGAGVGVSAEVIDFGHIDTVNGIHVHGNDGDGVFAWQAFAGLRYTINKQMGISVEYRYFDADSPSWHAEFVSGPISNTLSFGHIHTHAVSLAFDFRF
jgi:opacity protein-like surface antigen